MITIKREEFEKLEKLKQVEVFNKIILEQSSLNKASKITGIPKSTIKGRFEKLGYTYSLEVKQFVKDTDTPIEETCLTQPVGSNKQEANKNLVDITELELIVNRLIDKRLESLKEINNPEALQLSFKCDGDVKYRSFGIYKDVLDEFMTFAKGQPYSLIQLISQALLEFKSKYE